MIVRVVSPLSGRHVVQHIPQLFSKWRGVRISIHLVFRPVLFLLVHLRLFYDGSVSAPLCSSG